MGFLGISWNSWNSWADDHLDSIDAAILGKRRQSGTDGTKQPRCTDLNGDQTIVNSQRESRLNCLTISKYADLRLTPGTIRYYLVLVFV